MLRQPEMHLAPLRLASKPCSCVKFAWGSGLFVCKLCFRLFMGWCNRQPEIHLPVLYSLKIATIQEGENLLMHHSIIAQRCVAKPPPTYLAITHCCAIKGSLKTVYPFSGCLNAACGQRGLNHHPHLRCDCCPLYTKSKQSRPITPAKSQNRRRSFSAKREC